MPLHPWPMVMLLGVGHEEFKRGGLGWVEKTLINHQQTPRKHYIKSLNPQIVKRNEHEKEFVHVELFGIEMKGT